MYLSNDQMTKLMLVIGQLVSGSFHKYGHGTLDIPTFDIRPDVAGHTFPI